jgi:peptidoglycan/xylan/chitin deacetylase (PgdA/CDA1 family)
VLILCYHAVSPTWPAALSVTPEHLERQLEWLVRRGYRGVTFAEALALPPGRNVVVTFDDAYRSVLTLGAPILQRLGLPGTVFAPTAWMDRDEPMTWPGIDEWIGTEHESELMPLSWDELGDLADQGWEVGSHTRTHPRLTQVGDEQLRAELVGSREDCEARLGRPCRTIAYPYGDHDVRVRMAAREAGYDAACILARSQRHGDRFGWPRLGIYQHDERRRFVLKSSRTVRRLLRTRLAAEYFSR